MQSDFLPLLDPAPIVVAYGGGVDSTALLVGLWRRGTRPNLILMADTGSEKPQTWAYVHGVMQPWLRSVGFPEITLVRYEPKNFKHFPPYRSLHENCLTNGTLPSLAFGWKSCSLKWKVAPQDRFVAQWPTAQRVWALGGKLRKMIGYDCSPADDKRYAHSQRDSDDRYTYEYPLREWGWERSDCEAAIREAGLPVPVKSACFMCPASKPFELHILPRHQLRLIVMMEARAEPRLTTVQGLWRKATKARSGRMTDYIRSADLLPSDEIDEIRNSCPEALVRFQSEHGSGANRLELSAFLALQGAAVAPEMLAA